MFIRQIVFGILIASSTTTRVRAEPAPWSGIEFAVDKVGVRLAKGDDRQKILDEFNVALLKNAKDDVLKYGKRLSTDLTESIKTGAKADETDPVKRLAETKMYRDLLWFYVVDPTRFQKFVKENPTDPAAQILSADRKIIERLLPALQDRAPTRGYGGADLADTPHIPRVCDCAISLIQYHSGCMFYDNSSGGWFHTFDTWDVKKDRQKEVIEEVGAWWKACRDKSVTEGILAHLPRATSRSQTLMVRNLVELGMKGDREAQAAGIRVAQEFLRRRDDERLEVAHALAKIGDMTAVDVFYDELKSRQPGARNTEGPQLIQFLARHGERREWELLIETHSAETADAIVYDLSKVAAKVPYAIPILGVALTRTTVRGKRSVQGKDQPYTVADLATEYLRTQTGMDFGYRANSSEPQRAAAIRKAREWWDTKGKSKYTLDFIEQEMIRR